MPLMRVEPATARYTIEESDSLLRITIPARRAGQWMPWVGLLWIVAAAVLLWTANPNATSARFDPRAIPILVAFGCMIVVIGCVSSAALLWMNFGAEEITIAGRTLVRKLRAGPLRVQRKYGLERARDFRASARHAIACSFQLQPIVPLGSGRGSIQFSLEGKTHSLGSGLDETEVRAVLERLAAHGARMSEIPDDESAAAEDPRVAGRIRDLSLVLPAWRAQSIVYLAACGWGILVSRMTGESQLGWFWAAWGAFALLWLCLGRERIRIRDGQLTRRLELGPIGFDRNYRVAEIRNVRLAPNALEAGIRAWARRNISGGSVWFDHGQRLVRLGAGLGNSDACQLAVKVRMAAGLE